MEFSQKCHFLFVEVGLGCTGSHARLTTSYRALAGSGHDKVSLSWTIQSLGEMCFIFLKHLWCILMEISLNPNFWYILAWLKHADTCGKMLTNPHVRSYYRHVSDYSFSKVKQASSSAYQTLLCQATLAGTPIAIFVALSNQDHMGATFRARWHKHMGPVGVSYGFIMVSSLSLPFWT